MQAATQPGTFVDALFPPLTSDRHLAVWGLRIPLNLIRDVGLVVGFSWFVALCALDAGADHGADFCGVGDGGRVGGVEGWRESFDLYVDGNYWDSCFYAVTGGYGGLVYSFYFVFGRFLGWDGEDGVGFGERGVYRWVYWGCGACRMAGGEAVGPGAVGASGDVDGECGVVCAGNFLAGVVDCEQGLGGGGCGVVGADAGLGIVPVYCG